MQLCELLKPINNRFSGMLCKQGGRKGGGAFISVHLYEWSFCTCERERKQNYSQVLAVSAFYVGELCRMNYVGELCESRKMKSRAELSAKPKHNIKSFSKNQGVTVP